MPRYVNRLHELIDGIIDRENLVVIDRTSLYWGLLAILVLAVLFSSYLIG